MPDLSNIYFELAALGSALVWAVSSFLIRSQAAKMSPAAINTIRCAVAGIAYWILLPFDSPLSELGGLSALTWALLFASVVANITLGDTFSIVALKEIGLSRSMPLTGTFPLATIAFECLLLGAPFDYTLLVGALFVVTGIFFVARDPGQLADEAHLTPGSLKLGLLFAAGASIMWGLGTILLKLVVVNMTIVQANSIRMPLVALLLISTRMIPAGRAGLRDVDLSSILVVAASGLVGMGIGSYLYIYALTGLGPAKAVTLNATCPVFGLILAVLFLREKVSFWVLAGVACCLAGVWTVL